MMESGPLFTRWYERQPHLSQAVKFLILLPDDLKEHICQALIVLIKAQKNASDADLLRSVGPKKIIGLNKSQNKRRDYDQHPLLHHVMNDLYLLPDESQERIASHALLLIQYTQDYLKICREFAIDVDSKQLAQIVQAYMNDPLEGVPNILEKIQTDLGYRVQIRGEKLEKPD